MKARRRSRYPKSGEWRTAEQGDLELRGLNLAKFCHDLCTSLHVIRGYTEILQGEAPPGPEDIVARLAAASDAALALAQQYFELACLDAPGAENPTLH